MWVEAKGRGERSEGGKEREMWSKAREEVKVERD